MFKIVERRALNPTVTKLVIHAPLIAKKGPARGSLSLFAPLRIPSESL